MINILRDGMMAVAAIFAFFIGMVFLFLVTPYPWIALIAYIVISNI